LRRLFGILAPTEQPSREAESSDDMAQHKLFEAQPVYGIHIVQRLPPISDASHIRTV
jgi:hypothetical protein